MNLSAVPGVLGRIARERADDYRDAAFAPGGPVQRTYPFRRAITGGSIALIAEVKRASPSQGHIAALDPLEAARAYRQGGAAAISVLTEPRHFGGSNEALQSVSRALDLPTLRKDFVVHKAMLAEAAQWGAGAALLIVAVLGEDTAEYLQVAHVLGLDALVEVHDERELDLAIEAGAEIIGVNNRDLTTLEIDLATSPRLIRRARDAGYGGTLVAESGYHRREQIQELQGLADAVLVGSALAASGDLARASRELLGA
ncbi:indole-3-glycerol phosphate synthase TrpC [Deinococcus peraridilitoris]|uniref:indole-3-glycerol-phosphate synthase n=1 Tax=Deinococcus peraridilitoris (strain DSM 19664 / LMG 22246 / CIP 109416 / KR-200) TaxID=937777 RepID=L0A6I2_DEIPD|nr:indole-3-glycerol phosphate synthase TrpC [Deinococcus peraridilitoris]AFZ68792.1 Indole-3-glycerol phosphate synthase [Deinococcus peraridilitoris DSM 19664]